MVYQQRLQNGLRVIVDCRPGFSEKVAYLAADYGAIHTRFRENDKIVTTPAGIAHYLEHKLFDLPNRDVSLEFAELGANVNAFTSYDMTAYYFSCTESFSSCLKLLLEFVTTPYFTEETVEKEREIIGQEIDMAADAPDSKVFENLLTCMYREHPIRVPILGSRHSIAAITPESLYHCHEAFYDPKNLVLCVVGDVDPAEVIALGQTLQGKGRQAEKLSFDEPMTCASPFITEEMDVANSLFQLGLKAEPLGKGAEAMAREIAGDLAAEALFGESSALYQSLYEAGVIDASFGGGFESVDGMAMLTAFGESSEPERVLDSILEQARVLSQAEIPGFDRLVRSALGRRVRSLDSFESTCFRLCAYAFSDFAYYDFPGVYSRVRQEDVQEFLRRVVRADRAALSTITPRR